MTEHVLSVLPALRSTVSSDCDILHDSQDALFQERLARWTDIDKKVPAAIVLPRSKDDCLNTVRWALASSISFVPACGGHSQWSTIGREGIIIDLSRYADVRIDAERQTATVVGGVLSKQHRPLGHGNTVGAIPYFLGGGISITSSITGFGSDQILSTRLITASGELGAGQVFGLVLELTVKAYPLRLLRKQRGLIWAGLFVFPPERAEEISLAMKPLLDDGKYDTAGAIMVQAPPPHRTPSLVISTRYIGEESPQIPFQALYALNPASATGEKIPVQNANDHREALCAKDGFKRFGIAGLHCFHVAAFLQTVEVWKKLMDECPDAISTGFRFQWQSRLIPLPKYESANSLHDIRYWQNHLLWHTDEKSRDRVEMYNDMCIALMRVEDGDEYVDFMNGTRSGPLHRRYSGPTRLAMMRQLKTEWDGRGVFTRQLLD
ncbi:FAD binding domain-containing protein [Aspergillus ellipticus CBS 707.79]|uniref:FAD binding domain-containing protein n=1 Tax=Aspergillus ellipticus CBS 707.79 TaxID=1448320 RepID=A0A319CV19_9EURO|nr:FAD binding domain-containing protein [Aspergillus ellipticus CBS 707.79]